MAHVLKLTLAGILPLCQHLRVESLTDGRVAGYDRRWRTNRHYPIGGRQWGITVDVPERFTSALPDEQLYYSGRQFLPIVFVVDTRLSPLK